MKTYPSDIEIKLGFDQIRALLSSYCFSHRGQLLVERMGPTDQFETVKKWMDQMREMVSLKANAEGRITFEFPDFDEYLVKIKVPGTFLEPADFHELKRGIISVSGWVKYLETNQDQYPELSTLSEKIDIEENLPSVIDRVIDERGGVRDSASPALAQIRSSIVKSERAVRSAIQRILKKAKEDDLTEEDSSLTVRDGRLVIPIKAEHKKRIAGFVHDESATGQTVFLEPGEVLSLNNEVQELKRQERREILRILIALSDQVRENLPGLTKGVNLIEKLDFIHAKVRLGEKLNASIPQVDKSPKFQLIKAIHPLLYLSHKESNKPVIPLNLSLDSEHRILIISGPNAGGKSVALKTVGLLQYMVQCGLPVPVNEESRLGFFSAIYIDIGDTQSIEDDLSTYSAHITSMKYFLDCVDKKSLFLIDEFGKGTEPQFGGAIAESILYELNKKRSVGIITTHYQNLKKMGDETPGLLNGAMKYDQEALEPLFELEVGKPGSSFAFEIAGKIGLPQEIITNAKKKIGTSQVDYDRLLNELEREKGKYDKLNLALEKQRNEITKTKRDYEDLRSMVEGDKNRVLKEARKEARQILEQANREVERVIREIKEHQASKEKTRQVRRSLEEKKERLTVEEFVKVVKFKAGDAVSLSGQDTVGVIQKINGRQAEVLFGSIKSIVSTEKLQKSEPTPQVSYQKKMRRMGIDISDKMANFNHQLSILGMRADEAMIKVESFLDEALLVGVDEIRIVHGKGHGVLRGIVRNISKDHPRVATVEDEHADRGGAGISIIKLK